MKAKFKISNLFIYLALSIWGLTTVYPIIWVVLNSFKLKRFIRTDTFALPLGKMFSLENYQTAFQRTNIFGAYANSLIISISVTLAVICLAGVAAYALARYEFKGKKYLYGLVLAAMMFPVFSTVIPVFRMMFSWGIVNTSNTYLSLFSVMLPQIAGNLSFSIVVLLGFIRGLPIDMEEAAFIEGYDVYRTFFKIVLPVAKPSFATVAIFSFLWSYNDLFTQMFFLRDKNAYTITLLLNEISSQAGVNYGLMTSAVVLVVVPVLIVYMVLQKNIIKGLTAGALKG
jgi:raffinose/stachyose/melibiose transport system permease protein